MSKDGGDGSLGGGGRIYKPRDTVGIVGRIGECPSCSCR
jgi:hypothetical protein